MGGAPRQLSALQQARALFYLKSREALLRGILRGAGHWRPVLTHVGGGLALNPSDVVQAWEDGWLSMAKSVHQSNRVWRFRVPNVGSQMFMALVEETMGI